MRKFVPFLILLTFVAILGNVQAAERTDYTFVMENEAWFSGAVKLDNHWYIAGSTGIYDYDHGNFSKRWRIFGWNITDIALYGDHLLVALVEVQYNSSGGGGGEIIKTNGMVLNAQGLGKDAVYDILKSRILELDENFQIVNTVTFDERIRVASPEGVLNSFKIYVHNSNIYALTSGILRDNGTYFAIVRDVKNNSEFIEMYGVKIHDISFSENYVYLAINNYVDIYYYNGTLYKHVVNIGGYSTFINDLAVDNSDVWCAGYNVVDSKQNAAISVETETFDSEIMYASNSAEKEFTVLFIENHTAFVLSDRSAIYTYKSDSATGNKIGETDWTYVKNLNSEDYHTYDSLSDRYALRMNGDSSIVFYGGYIIGDNGLSAFYVTVHAENSESAPSNWEESAGVAGIPENKEEFSLYALVIISVIVIVLLLR